MFRPIKPHLLKPPALRDGDIIAVVAPAGPVAVGELDAGIRLIESSGYAVRTGRHVYDRKNYLAGDDPDRLSDFHAACLDPDVKAIFCTRGGYGSLRLLDQIDYSIFKKSPKIVTGYSDITALLLAVHARTGLITFHGPMVRALGPDRNDDWDRLHSLLTSKKPVEVDLKDCQTLIPGRTTGPLMGGNLSMVCHLVGTRYLPSLDGCILFLEDVGENLYRIDRMLTYLKLTGILKNIRGIIAGRFKDCGGTEEIDRLLLSTFPDPGVPLITGFPVGHGERNLAIPIGMTADLDTGSMTLKIKEACVQ